MLYTGSTIMVLPVFFKEYQPPVRPLQGGQHGLYESIHTFHV